MENPLAPDAYTAFFDIGQTLGSARFSPRRPHRLERLDVYPQVPAVLQELRDNDVRLGIVSNVGQETEEDVRRVLEDGQIYDYFEPDLLVYGAKDSPEIFRRAAGLAGNTASAERCLYVGEDREERAYALEAGFRVAPHPRLVWEVLNGERLRYIRLSVPPEHRSSDGWREAILGLSVVPLHATGENGTTVYAIATSGAASRLDDLGFEVLRLEGEDLPLATEVYFLRDDRQTRTGFLVQGGESRRFFDRGEEPQVVLASSEGGLYVALSGGHSVLRYHFDEALHGHTVKLMPGVGLLDGSGTNQTAGALFTSGIGPALSQEEVETLHREITPASIAADVGRYSGTGSAEEADGPTITSRHVQHEHGALAVATLARDLEEIGGGDFSVRLHRFTEVTMNGSFPLDNVEAELPGSDPEEMVLITAHLDSTAAFTDFEGRGYDPDRDPAPGADDDGSGIAAVLAAARAIKGLSVHKRPKRTIRFVLFNAEEEGLVGSGDYAREQRALGARITAVYQMDMIGYNREGPLSYEIHAGADSRGIQDRSLVLAERIGEFSKQVSPILPAPQIYSNNGPAQRDKDPAYNRSDHHSFHLVGYAACAVTEDFFAGPHPDSPRSEGNPNYHQTSDTFVDPEYVAAIARAVVAAAWATANS